MSLVVSDIRTSLPKGPQISPSVSIAAFDLEPSTSYGASELHTCSGFRPLSVRTKGRRRSRVVHCCSNTAAALQNTQWQHDCFAALSSEVRKNLRQHMMGWPADVRRFLAGAFAGAHEQAHQWDYKWLQWDYCVSFKVLISSLLTSWCHHKNQCPFRCHQQNSHSPFGERQNADYDRQQGQSSSHDTVPQ